MVYDDGRQECFLNRGGRRFVRGIMPAMLFFYAGLIYLFVVSEQGASARAYCYRKGVLLWFVLVQNKGSSNSNQQPPQEGNNNNTNAVVEETATTTTAEEEEAVALTERREQELLQASADRLHPERATQLMGLAIARQRGARRAQWIRSQRDRQRQQYLTQRQLQRLGLTEHDLQDDNNNNNNNGNDNNHEEEQQQQPRPTHLALKTKVYSVNMDNATTTAADADAADAVDEDNSKALHWTDNIRNHFKLTTTTAEEEATTTTRCAICLSNFQNGNRVGDLPCGHLFHKDCLKAWLQRKNQCPLCNNDRVAQPFCKTVPQNDDDNDEEQEQVTPTTTTTTNETNAATTTTDNIRQEEEEDDDEEEARNK